MLKMPLDATTGNSQAFLVNLRKRAFSLIKSILIGYVLVLLLLRLFESRLLFFPNVPGRLTGDWNPHGLPVQDVWLTSSDGTKLHAWWIPNDSGKFTFLAFHGNAGNIADRAGVDEFLWDTPANVFAVEYRGYGRSEGKPNEAGFYRDADAAFKYLVSTKGTDPKTVISFGQSLGTSVAAHLAAQDHVGGVVLEAPFPSASRAARRIFWFLPGIGLLLGSQLDTEKRLKEINAPLLIVQCNQDPVIPPELGQEVFNEARPPKYFVKVNGYCHEEASIIAPAQYRAGLQRFLATVEEDETDGRK
jgi:uncharacterized protein